MLVALKKARFLRLVGLSFSRRSCDICGTSPCFCSSCSGSAGLLLENRIVAHVHHSVRRLEPRGASRAAERPTLGDGKPRGGRRVLGVLGGAQSVLADAEGNLVEAEGLLVEAEGNQVLAGDEQVVYDASLAIRGRQR